MNFIKLSYLFALLISFIYLHSCKSANCSHGKTLPVNNNSDSAIYVSLNYNYPDTNLFDAIPNESTNPARGSATNKIYAHSNSTKALYVGECIEGYFYSRTTIFILDAGTMERVPYDTIIKYNMYLRKQIVDRRMMDSMGWQIVYP